MSQSELEEMMEGEDRDFRPSPPNCERIVPHVGFGNTYHVHKSVNKFDRNVDEQANGFGTLNEQVMFSCTLPVCSSNRKDAKKARDIERKKSLTKGKDRYTIVKGLAGGPDGISFESLFKKKHFLRARNNVLILEPYDDSEEYRKQATFLPLQDMWFVGYIVFESLLGPAHFIRRCGEQLTLQKYENSDFFKEDASFKLTRKRCIACVKIGSRVWTRAEKGCFLRGIVVAVDEQVHIKLENGEIVKHKKTAKECTFLPDIIPHPLEIDVGTRVLARWFNRHDTYYPAVVTATRRSYFDVRYDDGDKGCNVLQEIRLLKQPEVVGETGIPSWSSLDGLPRVGGLCIDAKKVQAEGQVTTQEQWSASPIQSPEERIESPSDPDTDREVQFGYENNYQYLSPANCQYHHQPVERNVSQVSGSSCDSGYHGSAGSSRQRKSGLWAVTHSKKNAYEPTVTYDSRFLSPFSYISHQHIPGLSDDKRNLSELSVTSSVDSGYQGGCRRHEMHPRVRGTKATSLLPCPGKAIPTYKDSHEDTWPGHEHTHEQQLSDNETSNSTNYSTNHDTDSSEHYDSNHITHSSPTYTTRDAAAIPNTHAKLAKAKPSRNGARNLTADGASGDGTEIVEIAPKKCVSHAPAQLSATVSTNVPKQNDGANFAKNGTQNDGSQFTRNRPTNDGCNIAHDFVATDGAKHTTNQFHRHFDHADYTNGSLLEEDLPRCLGMETVI